jgi:hypothetical protein
MVNGCIAVAITREEKSFRLKLTSPEKTTATICIPMAVHGWTAVRVAGKPLWLNGKANGEIPGIKPAGETDGHACFTVAPGTWDFEAR